jgi:glycerol-3-phosphate acyltransferase PlsY
VATGVGVYLALAPYAVLTTLVLWALIVYFSRYVSLGSILATAAVPLWTYLYYGLLQPHPHLKGLLIIGITGCGLIVSDPPREHKQAYKGNGKQDWGPSQTWYSAKER